MASYFQFDNEDHKALLPQDLRNSSDLETVAAKAERDVIQFFTRYISAAEIYSLSPVSDPLTGTSALATALGNGYYVFLRGYQVDAGSSDTLPALKVALRETIADVIKWRLFQGKTNPMFTGKEKQLFAPGATTKRFPPHWLRSLDLYDTRPPVLRI